MGLEHLCGGRLFGFELLDRNLSDVLEGDCHHDDVGGSSLQRCGDPRRGVEFVNEILEGLRSARIAEDA
jgi:hypothetical protein